MRKALYVMVALFACLFMFGATQATVKACQSDSDCSPGYECGALETCRKKPDEPKPSEPPKDDKDKTCWKSGSDSCRPNCQRELKFKCSDGSEYSRTENCCDDDDDDDHNGGGGGGGGGGGNGGGGGGGGQQGACTNYVASSSATVRPVTVRPWDEVEVRCNTNNIRLDCLTVSSASLNRCRYSRFEDKANVFVCEAGTNAGYYEDVKCVFNVNTASKCCAGDVSVNRKITIIGTDVKYEQKMYLPFGIYKLSSKVWTALSRGKGVRIELVCLSETCANGARINGTVALVTYPESVTYVEKKDVVLNLVGTGDDRQYGLRISVDKGSEAYIDYVSLKNSEGREKIKNGTFSQYESSKITTMQPIEWGEGDNKVGFYYGSVLNPKLNNDNGNGGVGGGDGTSTNSATLAIKLKLQGVTAKPIWQSIIDVQVKLGGKSTTQAKKVQFTANDQGVYSGEVKFDGITLGSGYILFIKPPKHLQKKICVSAPAETSGGRYSCSVGQISLNAGANALDLTGIMLMAGDLPEANGVQSGVIDSYDTSYIRQHLGSMNPIELAIGDVNFDGIINGQDYSLVLQALSIRYDEQ